MDLMESQNLNEEIDDLLVQYLELVDEYDVLRGKLCTLQGSVQQNISRANFSAARGIKFGAELYDSRMQAIRLCRVTADTEKCKKSITLLEKNTQAIPLDMSAEKSATEIALQNSEGPSQEIALKEDETQEKTKVTLEKTSYDPIRMFGILIPRSLRAAQAESVKMVNTIPRLVELDAELAETEIRIRRLRECRAEDKTKSNEVVDQSSSN